MNDDHAKNEKQMLDWYSRYTGLAFIHSQDRYADYDALMMLDIETQHPSVAEVLDIKCRDFEPSIDQPLNIQAQTCLKLMQWADMLEADPVILTRTPTKVLRLVVYPPYPIIQDKQESSRDVFNNRNGIVEFFQPPMSCYEVLYDKKR